jgi:hypothetical protein
MIDGSFFVASSESVPGIGTKTKDGVEERDHCRPDRRVDEESALPRVAYAAAVRPPCDAVTVGCRITQTAVNQPDRKNCTDGLL